MNTRWNQMTLLEKNVFLCKHILHWRENVDFSHDNGVVKVFAHCYDAAAGQTTYRHLSRGWLDDRLYQKDPVSSLSYMVFNPAEVTLDAFIVLSSLDGKHLFDIKSLTSEELCLKTVTYLGFDV